MSTDFNGLPTGTLSNGALRLEYLATAGPRLVRLFLSGRPENQLAEVPGWGWDTPHGRYRPHGGHRLWCGPEDSLHTYVPDDEGLTVEELPDGVRLAGPAEPPTGIRKSIVVRLDGSCPALTVQHIIENSGIAPLELAPWAITQLPLGGVALLPQALPAAQANGPRPNRNLVLWPYTRLDDGRLHLGDNIHWVSARPRPAPLKVGCLSDRGWAAYYRSGVLFCKRFAVQADRPYPDMHCNVEIYCNDRVIELETLGPLTRLEPGETVTHAETWEWYSGAAIRAAPDELLQALDLVGVS